MTRPVLLRLALAECHNAAEWYDQRRAGRGVAFISAVRQVFKTLTIAAETYSEVHGVREAAVTGFP